MGVTGSPERPAAQMPVGAAAAGGRERSLAGVPFDVEAVRFTEVLAQLAGELR
jgi:hypothetical protein